MRSLIVLSEAVKRLLAEETKSIYGVRDVYICKGREAKSKLVDGKFRQADVMEDKNKVYYCDFEKSDGSWAEPPSSNRDLERLCKGAFDEIWKLDHFKSGAVGVWLCLRFFDEFQLNVFIETADPDDFYQGYEDKKYVGCLFYEDNTGRQIERKQCRNFVEFFDAVKKCFKKIM